MRTKRLLIVGGGSAGWMAAAYLDAALNRTGQRVVEIGLVESPDVPRIGVGEATIPSINHVLAVIGIGLQDFMRAVDGTFKQSIKFANWVTGADEHYYHAFDRYTTVPIDRSGLQWLMSDRSIPYMDTVSVQPVLCEMNLAPEMMGPWDFGARIKYAYHMNALKFADYLCSIATSRGVTHYREHVTDVEAADNGCITAVHTRSGRRLEADLFVDCTGFAALLIEKTLGVGFEDCSKWLLCDRAVTMHVPYDEHYPGHVRPYTTATALSAGWIWDIPLQDRRSLGYVHSSDFIDADAAETEARRLEGPHAEALDTRLVRFKVGRRERTWAGNCIAIGLAGGFIEPLESTGLYLSDLATVMLAEHFPRTDEMAPLAYRYNRIMADRFYEILDFINMHYCLTQRTDTEFWREVRRPERITDRLKAKLEFWKHKPPSAADFEDQFFQGQPDRPVDYGKGYDGDRRPPIDTGALFSFESYEAVMYGMDFARTEYARRSGPQPPPPKLLRHLVETLQAAPRKLPPHDVWLKRFAGMADYPARS